jgi:septal ring factor EnvC (AmiA/AmiB activator)
MNTSVSTKKKLKWLIAGTALSGLGIAMPSCPGEQAMQQQLDQLQAKSIENSRRAQQAEAQAKTLQNDMNQIKQSLNQVITYVQQQNTRIEQLTADVQSMKKPVRGGGKKGK